jgi:hypothetical protein
VAEPAAQREAGLAGYGEFDQIVVGWDGVGAPQQGNGQDARGSLTDFVANQGDTVGHFGIQRMRSGGGIRRSVQGDRRRIAGLDEIERVEAEAESEEGEGEWDEA